MIVVVDDLRCFRPEVSLDAEVVYFRTEWSALVGLALMQMSNTRVEQLFLDHDLGWDEVAKSFGNTQSIVRALQEAAVGGRAFNVGEILVHTSNPSVQRSMVQQLERYYKVRQIDATPYMTVTI